MSSEMRELAKEMRAGTPCYVAKVRGGRCVNGAECLRCAERLDWADRLERALLAQTEAGADGYDDGSGRVRDWRESDTHPQDASGEAEWREFTRDDLPPATHQTFIAPRGLVWCWVGHEVIDIVNKHAAAMQAKEAK